MQLSSDFDQSDVFKSNAFKSNAIKTNTIHSDTNLSIWGSAKQPANNGLFISTRLNLLHQKLQDYDPLIVFGHGKGSEYPDTLTIKDEKYTFVKAPVNADFSAHV